MKNIFSFIFIFFLIDSFSQKESTLILDTTCIPSNVNSIGNRNIHESLNRILNPHENELPEVDTFKLFFQADTISLVEYEKMKLKFLSKLNQERNLIRWTDTSFVVKTNKSEVNCRADKRDYSEFEYYIGYLKELQLYFISDVVARVEVGTLKVIDKVSGKIFYLQSPSDYPLETIEVSPGINLFSSYVNDYYSNESFVSLFEISKNGKMYSLKDYSGFFILNSRIKELIWLNENEFALKLNSIDEERKELEVVYMKIIIL